MANHSNWLPVCSHLARLGSGRGAIGGRVCGKYQVGWLCKEVDAQATEEQLGSQSIFVYLFVGQCCHECPPSVFAGVLLPPSFSVC